MAVLLLIPLLLAPAATTGDSTCAKIDAIQRVASSANGRWYQMAFKNKEMVNKNNKQMKHAECTGFNSEPPCSCTIYDFNTAIPEPFIPEYNITGYSYNMMSGKYDVQFLNMELVDNASNMAIFEVNPQGAGRLNNRSKMIIRGLATDDHQSFMVTHICIGEDPNAETDVWFLSRSPNMSDYSEEELRQALARINMTMDDMTPVMQKDCEYPPSQTNRNQGDKFRVF